MPRAHSVPGSRGMRTLRDAAFDGHFRGVQRPGAAESGERESVMA